MAVDFGTDIAILPDLGEVPGLVSGQANLAQAIVNRLTTTRGDLFYDPSYGIDVRELLSETITPARLIQIGADIEGECVKDQRILRASALVTSPGGDGMTIALTLVSNNGPFTLVLAVDQLTVSILRAGD